MKTIALHIDCRLEEVARLGAAIHAACVEQGATRDEADDVELAVAEAVNNVIRHARTDSTEGVHVLITMDSRGVEIEIPDGCPPGSILPPMRHTPKSREELPEGGMGLHIIHTVMDTVDSLERDGQCLLLLKKQFAASTPKA